MLKREYCDFEVGIVVFCGLDACVGLIVSDFDLINLEILRMVHVCLVRKLLFVISVCSVVLEM